MQYARLGNSDLEVSRVCLGTVFRGGRDEAECLAVAEAALDLGCTFLDCANVYRQGFSESVVGRAVQGRRQRVVVSTKVGARADGVRTGGLRRPAILEACEESLRRLRTDYLDCYLCHFPDEETPLAETLEALDLLVRQGKVRYVGCSNFEGWRLAEALVACRERGWTAPVVDQVGYSLLDRRPEDEVIPYCRRRGLAVTAYAPTAIGLLSGRFRYGEPPPPGSSWHRGPYNFRAAMTPGVGRVLEAVNEVAGRHGRTQVQVALAWCLRSPVVVAAILGCDTAAQVRENLAGADWVLPPEEVVYLDEVSEGQRLIVRKDCPHGYLGSTDFTPEP